MKGTALRTVERFRHQSQFSGHLAPQQFINGRTALDMYDWA